MSYSKISSNFFEKKTWKKITKISAECVAISLYLMTSPYSNLIGIYKMPAALLSHETGISIDKVIDTVKSLCEVGFCEYDEENSYIWVCDRSEEDIGNLKPTDNQLKTALKIFKKLPEELSFKNRFLERNKNIMNHLIYHEDYHSHYHEDYNRFEKSRYLSENLETPYEGVSKGSRRGLEGVSKGFYVHATCNIQQTTNNKQQKQILGGGAGGTSNEGGNDDGVLFAPASLPLVAPAAQEQRFFGEDNFDFDQKTESEDVYLLFDATCEADTSSTVIENGSGKGIVAGGLEKCSDEPVRGQENDSSIKPENNRDAFTEWQRVVFAYYTEQKRKLGDGVEGLDIEIRTKANKLRLKKICEAFTERKKIHKGDEKLALQDCLNAILGCFSNDWCVQNGQYKLESIMINIETNLNRYERHVLKKNTMPIKSSLPPSWADIREERLRQDRLAVDKKIEEEAKLFVKGVSLDE